MYGDPRDRKGSQSQLCRDASGLIKPYTVLDVGCGIGHLVPFVLSPGEGFGERVGMTYTGLDKSPFMLEAARGFFPEQTFLEEDATDFDLGYKFDTVISVSLLLHLLEEPARKALACMWNHVAPGGRLIVGMETMGNRVQKRSSGLILRNMPVKDFTKILESIAGYLDPPKISWSHQKIVYQTISEILFSESTHRIMSHNPIARTTIFTMERY